MKVGPIGCSETSASSNYYYSLRNNPEERRSAIRSYVIRKQLSDFVDTCLLSRMLHKMRLLKLL